MRSRWSSAWPGRSWSCSRSRPSRATPGLPETTRNALRVLTLLGRTDIPVAAGAAGPLVRPLHVADDVHGASGLEGADLPEPGVRGRARRARSSCCAPIARRRAGAGDDRRGRAADEHRAAGAHASRSSLDRIASIRVMGGAITEGNTTASAEFNIWQDPEAARIVFDCGRPITLMTLDTTHQALFGDGGRRAAGGPRDAGRRPCSPTCCGSSPGSMPSATAGTARRSTTPSPSRTSPCPDLVRTRAVSRRRGDDQRADPRPDRGGPLRADRAATERRGGARDRPGSVSSTCSSRRSGPWGRSRRVRAERVGRAWRSAVILAARRVRRERRVGPPVARRATGLRYVALGDSYTIGTSVEAAERFPDQLVGGARAGQPTLRSRRQPRRQRLHVGATSSATSCRRSPSCGPSS